jgi:hypothetical protein
MPGLIAAAAILTDYVLTGCERHRGLSHPRSRANPRHTESPRDRSCPRDLANLRGEGGRDGIRLPTYGFVAVVFLTSVGLVECLAGARWRSHRPPAQAEATLGLFIVLRVLLRAALTAWRRRRRCKRSGARRRLTPPPVRRGDDRSACSWASRSRDPGGAGERVALGGRADRRRVRGGQPPSTWSSSRPRS